MNLVRRERTRLRRAYLKNKGRRIPELLRTREFTKAAIPLLPWFVATCVEARTTLQIALLVPGAVLTMLWLGFVFWTLLAVEARVTGKHDT